MKDRLTSQQLIRAHPVIPVKNMFPLSESPRDECGVFAVYAPGHDVARLTYFALYALQHRGQESAGITTAAPGEPLITRRELGLVNQVFSEHDLKTLRGDLAIGHVRYSTTGASSWENSQPVHRHDRFELALAHNGNLTQTKALRQELRQQGVVLHSTSDSELLAALIATAETETVEEAVAQAIGRVHGAYSTVVICEDRVVAFRDRLGIRPLVIGELDGCFCVASESCALDIIGATYVRDVKPGEIVTLSADGLLSQVVNREEREAFCVFEYIYFARPDSRFRGEALQAVRGRMGEILAQEAPAPSADLVISVPDSGNAAARGFARMSGLPQDDGFVKNRYVARTFIQPGQELRKHGLRLKFNPLKEIVSGRKLVVVDDSIVRGNTTRQIIGMLRQAGAQEVHLRISAPPIRYPCYYGVDMSEQDEMVAHNRSVEEVTQELGCDSLAYLSLEGVYRAVRGEAKTHCDACFSGQFPLER